MKPLFHREMNTPFQVPYRTRLQYEGAFNALLMLAVGNTSSALNAAEAKAKMSRDIVSKNSSYYPSRCT